MVAGASFLESDVYGYAGCSDCELSIRTLVLSFLYLI